MSNQPQAHVADEREVLDRLEAVALAATQGPWEYGFTTVENQAEAVEICRQNIDTTAAPIPEFYEVFLSDGRRTALVGNGPNSAANAQFISTFGPINVLALIRMARAAGAPAETPKPDGHKRNCPAYDSCSPIAKCNCGYDAAQSAPAPATDARFESIRDFLADYIGDNWPMRKLTLQDIENRLRAIPYAAMLSANSPREAG